MNDFERAAYPDTLRIPKAGDVVYVKFKDQPYREERLGEKLSGGGEGNVYATEHYRSMVIKLYHPKNLTVGRVEKIAALAEEIADVNSEIFDYICWPKATVYDFEGGHMIGYLMEKVPDGAVPLETLIAQIADDCNPLDYDRTDLVELCRRIAERFSLLHRLAEKRLLMCDVNPSNILIAPNTKQVYFVDLDSYQYDSNSGKRLRCPVGRREYTSPELYERMREQQTHSYAEVDRTAVDEGFAVAVLYFTILTLGCEPFENYGESYEEVIRRGKFVFSGDHLPNAIWNNLSERLQGMFKGIFMNRKTYGDSEWIDAFVMLQADLAEGKFCKELRPHTYPLAPYDHIKEHTCNRCGERFTGSRLLYDKYPFCRDCMVQVNREEKICHRVTCDRCGQIFVINEADRKVISGKVVCPDCNPIAYVMRRSLFTDYENVAEELTAMAMKKWEEN